MVMEDAPFSLDDFMSKGLQPDEEELPKDAPEGQEKPQFVPNASALATLQDMGFPEVRCIKALYNTGNSDADSAMNWLFSHMEDPDIDQPLNFEDGSSVSIDLEQVDTLSAMGFTTTQAKKALKKTGGNMERAVEWLFSHTDDMGDDEETVGGGSKETVIPGDNHLPANFQLDSIVCHKGGSIHAGLVILGNNIFYGGLADMK